MVLIILHVSMECEAPSIPAAEDFVKTFKGY